MNQLLFAKPLFRDLPWVNWFAAINFCDGALSPQKNIRIHTLFTKRNNVCYLLGSMFISYFKRNFKFLARSKWRLLDSRIKCRLPPFEQVLCLENLSRLSFCTRVKHNNVPDVCAVSERIACSLLWKPLIQRSYNVYNCWHSSSAVYHQNARLFIINL